MSVLWRLQIIWLKVLITKFKMFLVTDREIKRANRLADFNKYRIPSVKRVVLPEIPSGTSISAFSWSLNDGIKWRVSVTVGGDCCLNLRCIRSTPFLYKCT